MTKYRKITPAIVLKLIRDGSLTDTAQYEEIANQLLGLTGNPVDAAESLHMLNMAEDEVRVIVDRLAKAGLVQKRQTTLTPTAGLNRVLVAMDVSLTWLSQMQSGTRISVSPQIPRSPTPVQTADVFVAMPFSNDLTPVYTNAISGACRNAGITVARADDIFSGGAILQIVWEHLCSCKVVIADCTGKNPNVFYEIGLAHVLGRETILITQTMDDIPSDLRHYQCLVYENSDGGLAQLQGTLTSALSALSVRRQNPEQASINNVEFQRGF